MIENDDTAMIDKYLMPLPELLLRRGITLKQKHGYKAGKLYAKRNWCQLVDGDVQLPVYFPNSQGQVKTWKLFARFDVDQPPLWPWDKPECYERRKAQWMPAGGDVWGMSYEEIKGWASQATSQQILHRLVNDLQVSFDYSVRRYK